MRINNNITAMNTHRQYSINVSSVAKSTEKLSSGYRVNRAGDDAAGLAISEKMRAQIRGLTMASKNSSDAISLVQTAEGALQETHNILQRMRELATQSASDTNETSIDRAALDAEFQQLIKEIDDTAKKTRFNDMGVIDGSYGQTGGIADATAYLEDNTTFANNRLAIGSLFTQLGADTAEANVSVDNGGKVFKLTGIKYEDGTTGADLTVSITADHLKVGSHTITFSDGTSFSYQLGKTINEDANELADPTTNELAVLKDSLVSVAGSGTPAKASVNKLTIQTGANQGDELRISINGLTAKGLGLVNSLGENYSIATGAEARNAISITNTAINLVSSERAKLGALQNRLNHKIQNLDSSAENLSAAESRIRDLDMAKEMTNYTRNNILQQASTAMLAQANMAPQGVLSLIG